MKKEVLNYFYKSNGIQYEFCKQKFICMIRDVIINRNTIDFLYDGFPYFDNEQEVNVKIPCDDISWSDYIMYEEGIRMNIIQFPFTIKLEGNCFLTINSKEQYEELYKTIINFRIDVKKRSWAIQYGFSYKDDDYDQLEDLDEKELLEWEDPRPHARMKIDDITMDVIREYGYNI